MLKTILWIIVGFIALISLPIAAFVLYALSPIIGILMIIFIPAIVIGVIIGYKSKN